MKNFTLLLLTIFIIFIPPDLFPQSPAGACISVMKRARGTADGSAIANYVQRSVPGHRVVAPFRSSTMAMQVSGDTAVNITFYSVTLQAIADPAGLETGVSFEFGTDTTYGYTIIPDPDTIGGFFPVAFQSEIVGIASGKVYHFRVKTQNSSGVFYGIDHTFSTSVAPPNNFTFKPERCQSVTDTYTDLGSDGTVIPVNSYDDSDSGPLDIGFGFSFAGATFSQFILNTNGFIKLGNIRPADSVQFFNAPYGFTGTMGGIFSSPHFADVFLLSPFNHDLQAGTSPPEFRFHTAGAPGSRVCTIQFKNLMEKGEPPARQFNNIEFQIRIHETTNFIEFVYGTWQPSGNPATERGAAVGLKGTANTDSQLLTVSTWYPWKWNEVDFYAFNYYPDWFPFNFGQSPNPLPLPGSTFAFYPRQLHDASVSSIYTLGKLPIPYGLPHTPAARIQNSGYDTLTNIIVNMTVTGSCSFAGTDTIPLLKPDSGITVSFQGCNPLSEGYNNVNVTLSGDDYMPDNSKNFVQEINTTGYNYCDTMPIWYGIGFTWNGLPGSPSGLWLSKYHVSGTKNIIGADIGVGVGEGQAVYAVLLNSSGVKLAQSDTLTLTEENSWQYHRFDFPNTPVVSNSDFYIGLAQTESAQTYFPLGVQVENPIRRNAFYTASIDGSGINESVGGSGRYCIGAVMDSSACRPSFLFSCNESGYQQYINDFTTTGGAVNISNTGTGCPVSSDGYTYYPAQTIAAEQGTPFNFAMAGVFDYHSITGIWADWNHDGDFNDTLELVHSKTWFDNSPWAGTITVPPGAVLGNTRLRVVLFRSEFYIPPEPCRIYESGETEEYNINVLPGVPMTYLSGSVVQCDTLPPVLRGSYDNKIIRIKINTTGALSPLHITGFNLASAGSTDFTHDISQVKIYWTGADTVLLFASATLFGTAADLSAPVTGNQQLGYQTNYFWVTFDSRDTATLGNYIDAGCSGYMIGPEYYSPAMVSPPGAQIIDYCIPGFRYSDGCATGYGISGFSTTGGSTNISNLNNGCPANLYSYSNYTGQVVTVRQGSGFTFNTSTTTSRKLYIDWNQDTDFLESNEIVSTALSGTVTVPSDAVTGITRLRVISFRQLPGPGGLTLRGCGVNNTRGETEDYTIHILPYVPENDTVQNLTLGSGQDTCISAFHTISIAGSGTDFLVQNGGSASFIAGQKIVFHPLSKVFSGGYLQARITPDSTFCNLVMMPVITAAEGKDYEDSEFEYSDNQSLTKELFRVYPNPTSGNFTIEFTGISSGQKAKIQCYDIPGSKILEKTLDSSINTDISLFGQKPGVYLLKIFLNGSVYTRKIVKY